MTIHYMDGGPFETTSITGRVVFIVAYDAARNMFLAAPLGGKPFWNSHVAFDPTPPIPAAARKPQVGEVWIGKGPGAPAIFLAFIDEDDESFLSILSTDNSWNWYFPDDFARPATPAESEPFRPILEGLKRSLGEP